jgi:hypothetical protein
MEALAVLNLVGGGDADGPVASERPVNAVEMPLPYPLAAVTSQ